MYILCLALSLLKTGFNYLGIQKFSKNINLLPKPLFILRLIRGTYVLRCVLALHRQLNLWRKISHALSAYWSIPSTKYTYIASDQCGRSIKILKHKA